MLKTYSLHTSKPQFHGEVLADKRVEALLDFSAQVLYEILRRHIGFDKAFQLALHSPKAVATKYVPLKMLYRVSRSVVSDYYLLRYAENHIYGRRGNSTRRLVRLWLLLRAHEELFGSFWDSVYRYRKKLLKSLPRKVESVEELLENIENPVKQLAVELSYPQWFVEVFVHRLGIGETRELLEGLNEEKWWIRVNTLKADVDTIAEKLYEKGVVVRRDKDLDYMLEVIDYNEPLHHLDEMWRGEIVFQDKASAMVVEALQPSENDRILDLAAAPGIKASLIMQLTENKARLVLVDVSWERTRRMLRLLKLYGVDMTRVDIVVADSRDWRPRTTFDKVLLDAPCTSSGTIGKDPAVKIHLEDNSWVTRFPQLQHDLLRAALLADTDAIVYATCSLLPSEGEEHFKKLKHMLREPPIPGSPGYPDYNISRFVKRFFPHKHSTQGFFIASLAKNNP